MYQMLPITASPADRFLALLKPDCKVPTANFADSALNANTAFYWSADDIGTWLALIQRIAISTGRLYRIIFMILKLCWSYLWLAQPALVSWQEYCLDLLSVQEYSLVDSSGLDISGPDMTGDGMIISDMSGGSQL